MVRSLSQIPEMILRERLIRHRNDLGRLEDHLHNLERWYEMHDVRYFSTVADDVRDEMFKARDFATMLQISSSDYRHKLESEIEDIECELEQRDLDALDSRDPSGGVAA
jgi:hypothetical protein